MKTRCIKALHYTIATVYEKKGQHGVAVQFYKKSLRPNHRLYYKYGRSLHRTGNYGGAVHYLELAVYSTKNPSGEYLLRYGEALLKSGRYVEAEDILRKSIKADNTQATAYYILGVVLCLQRKWWQAEDTLLTAKQLGYKTPKFYYRLGQASLKMSKYQQSSAAFRIAAEQWSEHVNRPIDKSRLFYYAGLAAELGGFDSSAIDDSYAEAERYSSRSDAVSLGVGIFHELNNDTERAIKSYRVRCRQHPEHADKILYRLAQLFYEKGEYSLAKEAANECLEYNYIDPKHHRIMGVINNKMGDHKSAALYFYQALERGCELEGCDIRNFALSSLKINKPEQAKDMLILEELVQKASKASDLSMDGKLSTLQSYVAIHDQLPVKENTILYESFNGKSVSDNPAAIMYQLLDNEEYSSLQHVVVLNDIGSVPKDLKSRTDIVFIPKNSMMYAYYLATCQYLVNNSTFPRWFIRRDRQIYLNTWHGVPWKHLGKDIHSETVTNLSNVQRNFLQATHMSHPNKYTNDIMLDRYDVRDIMIAENREIGYPRIDTTLNLSVVRKKEIISQLGLDSSKPVVFYAPTWRGELGSGENLDSNIREDLAALEALNISLIYKGHYFAGSDKESMLDKYMAPDHISTNELLAVADVLITDYSSVAFDYMATDRPIVYYLYDYDTYKTERGLYFDYDELPGLKAFDRESMVESVKESVKSKTQRKNPKYVAAKRRFCPHEDGHASGRAVDLLMNHHPRIYDSEAAKKNILIYIGSFSLNGITIAGLNLINKIDTDKYNVFLLVDIEQVKVGREKIELFNRLPSTVRVIQYTGGRALTARESKILRRRNELLLNLSTEEEAVYRKVHEREARRLFSDISFDVVINFEGYSRLFAPLLSCVGKRRVIYLHSDMMSEKNTKYSHLEAVFKSYQYYDELISVSSASNDVNMGSLSDEYKIDRKRFDYTDNVQNPEGVIAKSKLKLENEEDERYFADDATVFVTVGRLSIEKDQEKLIRAFKQFYDKNPDSKLLIIGDGPLMHKLKQLVFTLSLGGRVILLGGRDNPYAYIKRADCFVLSSNYEAQGLVLYEAMILNKPIIATDIPVIRAGLGDGRYGILFENSVDGLVGAMADYYSRKVTGKLNFEKFNVSKYNKKAIDAFHKKVLGDSK